MITFKKIEYCDLEFVSRVRNLYAEKYLHNSVTFNLCETIEWFDKTKPNYYMILNDGETIGYFRLNNHSVENKNIYIGADIAPEFSGKGFGYLAYKEFIPQLFEMYNLNKITLEVLATNDRAIHLYKKLGFVIEGVKRDEVLKPDGYVDSIIMSILKNEYGK